MAEDDIMDFDDDADYDWYYVEDDFPLADELAESQIPNPGYVPGRELEYESFDFDLYEYWTDQMFGDDEYWDTGGMGAPTSGAKRKRGMAALVSNMGNGKRRKISLKDTEGGNVRFIPLAARTNTASRAPVLSTARNSFALLPDWRQQFAGTTGVVASKAMPMDMQQAAQADDHPTPEKGKAREVSMAEADEDDMMGGDEGDLQAELAALDPEILKAILKQKMGDTGLQGMDETAFMQTIAKMLSGEEGADDAAGELASSLLGRVTEGTDQGVSGWLSQQGVTLDDTEDGDENIDESSVISVSQRPSIAESAARTSTQASPRDSAIGSSQIGIAELRLHGSSPLTGKKRSAPAGPSGSVKKPKADVTAESSNTAIATEDDDTIAVAPPADIDDNIAVASSKKANIQTLTANKSRSAKTNNPFEPSTNGLQRHSEPADEIKVEPLKTRTTRKRKIDADAEDSSHGLGESRQTKQAKRTAEAAQENATAGRRTRSAKTRSGK